MQKFSKILAHQIRQPIKKILHHDQVGFIPNSQGCFNICKINVIHHISKRKDKNHMIISIDAEKAFDKIQHWFMIKKKSSYQGGYRGNISQYNKSYLWQTHSQYNTQWGEAESHPAKIWNRQGCPLSPLLFNIVLEVLVTAIREEKEIKAIQIGSEEVKLSPFADDMILYIENPKDATRKLLELIKDRKSTRLNSSH